MPTVTLSIRGDQLGTYTNLTGTGNGANRIMTINGLQPVGTADDVYTVIVEQVNPGVTQFENGQFVTILDAGGNEIMPRSGIQPDIQQGLGAGDEHLVINSSRFLIDLGGVGTGTVTYTNADQSADTGEGDNDGNLDFNEVDPPCFTPGTLIDTPGGRRPAETLRAGDLVTTLDHGPRPISWVGIRSMRFARRYSPFRPIEIKPGSLGPGLPERPLAVSPQHNILLRKPGEDGVLVPAKALLDLPGVRIMHGCRAVDYVSILLPEHNVLWAEGCLSESLWPGPYIVSRMPLLHRLSVRHFTHDTVSGRRIYGPSARPILTVRQGREVAEAFWQTARQGARARLAEPA